MDLKAVITIASLLLFATSCTSREEKITQEFVGHVKSLNIEGVKNMSTENTQFYIKILLESIVSLGDEESINQLKEILSTIDCFGDDKIRTCTYLDEDGEAQSFEIKLVEGYGNDGKVELFVDIEKKYFLGE